MPHRRIIVARLPVVGHWSAYFQDTPGKSFAGPTADIALGRLAESLSAFGTFRMEQVGGSEQSGLLEVDLIPLAGLPCPDCRGTGEYVGLTTREKCRKCGGRGTVV